LLRFCWLESFLISALADPWCLTWVVTLIFFGPVKQS